MSMIARDQATCYTQKLQSILRQIQREKRQVKRLKQQNDEKQLELENLQIQRKLADIQQKKTISLPKVTPVRITEQKQQENDSEDFFPQLNTQNESTKMSQTSLIRHNQSELPRSRSALRSSIKFYRSTNDLKIESDVYKKLPKKIKNDRPTMLKLKIALEKQKMIVDWNEVIDQRKEELKTVFVEKIDQFWIDSVEQRKIEIQSIKLKGQSTKKSK